MGHHAPLLISIILEKLESRDSSFRKRSKFIIDYKNKKTVKYLWYLIFTFAVVAVNFRCYYENTHYRQ